MRADESLEVVTVVRYFGQAALRCLPRYFMTPSTQVG